MVAITGTLSRTMGEEIVYNALRDSHRVSLPPYIEGSYYFWEECAEEIQRIPLDLQADIIWCALEDAHDTWRSQPEVMELLLTEECSICLNAFTRLELAGPQVYNIWAGKFYKLFSGSGFEFEQKIDIPEIEPQMTRMEELNFTQPILLRSIFVVNRRRFIQGKRIADYGDLLTYVSSMQNDIFGVVQGPPTKTDSPAKRFTFRIAHALYDDENARSMQFRVARQIAAANGNDRPPLSW